jgi:hypothetical protein
MPEAVLENGVVYRWGELATTDKGPFPSLLQRPLPHEHASSQGTGRADTCNASGYLPRSSFDCEINSTLLPFQNAKRNRCLAGSGCRYGVLH